MKHASWVEVATCFTSATILFWLPQHTYRVQHQFWMICFEVCDEFLFWYGNDPSRIQRRFCQRKAISYNELIRCFKIASSILLSLISEDGHIYVSGYKRIHFRSLYENTFVLQCTTQIFLARIYCEIPKEQVAHPVTMQFARTYTIDGFQWVAIFCNTELSTDQKPIKLVLRSHLFYRFRIGYFSMLCDWFIRYTALMENGSSALQFNE